MQQLVIDILRTKQRKIRSPV